MTNAEEGRGQIKVWYGPMGGEKTEKLISAFSLEGGSLAIVPEMDFRSGGRLKSHNGREVVDGVLMVPVTDPGQILEKVRAVMDDQELVRVLVDETNFFTPALVGVIGELAEMGLDVFAAGLLLDSDLNDFGATREVALMADEAIAMFARCDFEEGQCVEEATYNYFKGVKPGQVEVGAFDLYGSACPKHYNHFRKLHGLEPVAEETIMAELWRLGDE